MLIAIGTKNPIKIAAAQHVFQYYDPKVEIQVVSTISGVPDQPLHDEETFLGAKNRAMTALHAVSDSDYGVGIEGGICETPHGYMEHTIVVIVDAKGNVGAGESGGLLLPEVISQEIKNGKNLEQAVDHLLGTDQIGEKEGLFGVMTNNFVTRQSGIEHAISFAFARFLHLDLYQKNIPGK